MTFGKSPTCSDQAGIEDTGGSADTFCADRAALGAQAGDTRALFEQAAALEPPAEIAADYDRYIAATLEAFDGVIPDAADEAAFARGPRVPGLHLRHRLERLVAEPSIHIYVLMHADVVDGASTAR